MRGLLWVLCLLFHDGFLPGGESSSVSFLSEDWPSHVVPPNNGWGESEYAQTHTVSLLENSLVESEDGAFPNTASLTSIHVSDNMPAKDAGHSPVQGASRKRFFMMGLGISLALLLCAGLLTRGVKRPSAPKEEAFPKSDEGAVAEEHTGEPPIGPTAPIKDLTLDTRARLETVRTLLPAAEKLAAAVDSVQAKELLSILQASVGEPEAETEKVEDSSTLEASLERALGALRELHESALQQAQALVQADALLPAFPSLGPWGAEASEAMLEVEQGLEADALGSFVTSFRSLNENATRLAMRFNEVGARLSSERQFIDEKDGSLLVSTAADLECLRATDDSKRRATVQGQKLRHGLILCVKALLLGDREESLQQLKRNLALLALHEQLVRNAWEELEGPEAAAAPAKETEALLNTLEDMLEEARELVEQASSEVQSMRTSTTVEDVAVADRRAEELEERAFAVLTRCRRVAQSLPMLPESFDLTTKELLINMATVAYESALPVNAVVQRALQAIKARSAMHSPGMYDPSAISTQYVNHSIHKSLLDSITQTAHEAETWLKDTEASLEALRQSEEVKYAMEQMQRAVTNVDRLLKEKELSVLQMLTSFLLRVLEGDIDHAAAIATSAMAHEFDPTCSELPQLQELQRQFQAGRMAAKDAKTLSEAAEAAASMRARAFEMENLVYGYMRKNTQL